MRKLIVHGALDMRNDAVIDYDDEEYVVFSIQRQGDYHGPDEPQLWCTIGKEEEREAFEKREFVPHWLRVDTIDAEALDVVKAKTNLSV